MLRRRPQLISIAALLLIAAVVAIVYLLDGAGGRSAATPTPGTAVVAAGGTNAAPTATAQVTGTSQRVTATVAAGANQPNATRANATATATRAQPTATRTAAPPRATTTPTRQPAARPTPTPEGNLPTIAFARLPQEAQETIRLIDTDGPFPYDRDGIVFGNRERLLPIKAEGYYHEYTVITPGSSDRGERRIISGESGELYYTDDHYESFKRVIR